MSVVTVALTEFSQHIVGPVLCTGFCTVAQHITDTGFADQRRTYGIGVTHTPAGGCQSSDPSGFIWLERSMISPSVISDSKRCSTLLKAEPANLSLYLRSNVNQPIASPSLKELEIMADLGSTYARVVAPEFF
jgi:hypothetical protein